MRGGKNYCTRTLSIRSCPLHATVLLARLAFARAAAASTAARALRSTDLDTELVAANAFARAVRSTASGGGRAGLKLAGTHHARTPWWRKRDDSVKRIVGSIVGNESTPSARPGVCVCVCVRKRERGEGEMDGSSAHSYRAPDDRPSRVTTRTHPRRAALH